MAAILTYMFHEDGVKMGVLIGKLLARSVGGGSLMYVNWPYHHILSWTSDSSEVGGGVEGLSCTVSLVYLISQDFSFLQVPANT